jgi:hypothetical protein
VLNVFLSQKAPADRPERSLDCHRLNNNGYAEHSPGHYDLLSALLTEVVMTINTWKNNDRFWTSVRAA